MALTRVDYPPINILQLPTHKICLSPDRVSFWFDLNIGAIEAAEVATADNHSTSFAWRIPREKLTCEDIDNTKKSIVKSSFKPHHSASGIVLAHFFGSTRSATHVCCLTEKLTTNQIWLAMTWKFFFPSTQSNSFSVEFCVSEHVLVLVKLGQILTHTQPCANISSKPTSWQYNWIVTADTFASGWRRRLAWNPSMCVVS